LNIDRTTLLLVALIAAIPPTLAIWLAYYKFKTAQDKIGVEVTAVLGNVDGKVDALIRAARAEGRLEANEERDRANGILRERNKELEAARQEGRQEKKGRESVGDGPEHK
jgi:hypothetical protein